MTTIDITRAVIRDTADKDCHTDWTKRYVDWLVENVGMQVHFEPGTAMDQGKGWKLYQKLEFVPQGAAVCVLVDIDDPYWADVFALKWC